MVSGYYNTPSNPLEREVKKQREELNKLKREQAVELAFRKRDKLERESQQMAGAGVDIVKFIFRLFK